MLASMRVAMGALWLWLKRNWIGIYFLAYLHGSQYLSSVINYCICPDVRVTFRKTMATVPTHPWLLQDNVPCAAHSPEINGEKLPQLYLRL